MLEFLIKYKLTQERRDWLLNYRRENWEDIFDHYTVEELKNQELSWMKMCLIEAIQDLLDALKRRKRASHGRQELKKKPYVFEFLNLIGMMYKYNPSQKRTELEELISKRIKEINRSAKG